MGEMLRARMPRPDLVTRDTISMNINSDYLPYAYEHILRLTGLRRLPWTLEV